MPSTPEQRARERRRKIKANTDAASLPPRTWRWPSEREMTENLNRYEDKGWSSGAARVTGRAVTHGKGTGAVRHAKEDY